MLSDRHYMRGAQRVSFRPRGSVIKHLIVANVVVFLLTLLGRDLTAPILSGMPLAQAQDIALMRGSLMQGIVLNPYGIRHFEVWRLVTYMFGHASFFHLLFNMWGLYLFGSIVEQRLGSQRFLGLYLVSGVVGGLCWVAANWGVKAPYEVMYQATLGGQAYAKVMERTAHQISSLPEVVRVLKVYGSCLGASGGVFGVMMAAAMSFPNLRIVLLFPPIPMRLRNFVLIYGLIEASMAWQEAAGDGGGIAHLAHLGGLLGAFFYMKHLGFQSPYSWLSQVRAAWRRRSLRMVPPDGPRPPPVPPAAGLSRDLETETDRILDKIGAHGIQSLTPEERRTLEIARERLRQRSGR